MTAVDFFTNPCILTARFKSFFVKLNRKTKNTTRTTTQPMTKTAMKKTNLTENLSLSLPNGCSSSRLKSARHENATQIVICKKKSEVMTIVWENSRQFTTYSLYTDVALIFPAVYIFITRARRTLRKNIGSVNRLFTTPPCTNFTAKLRLSNDCGNTILMTCHYLDVGRASHWLKQISLAVRPIRSTTQV